MEYSTSSSSNKEMDPNHQSHFAVYDYTTLLYVFQYLNVQDLLRVRCVCTTWRDVAEDRHLWRTVRVKGCRILSFERLAHALQKHGTVNLDLRGMCSPLDRKDWEGAPSSFSIHKINFLKRIEFGGCPASVIEELAKANPKLEAINALHMQTQYISLNVFASCINLRELRLKFGAYSGCILNTLDFSPFNKLKHLKHLSLTSFNNLYEFTDVIAYFNNLESLELGHFRNIPNRFATDILITLNKLEKLRLERCIHSGLTHAILNTVKNMPKLELLELVNVNFDSGLGNALSACTNIKKLLLIPFDSTPNHKILGGVFELRNTLTHFVWGLTLEQLRSFDNRQDILSGDNILLKPNPVRGRQGICRRTLPFEVRSLSALQKWLLKNLPTTRVKILKFPSRTACDQKITEILDN